MKYNSTYISLCETPKLSDIDSYSGKHDCFMAGIGRFVLHTGCGRDSDSIEDSIEEVGLWICLRMVQGYCGMDGFQY